MITILAPAKTMKLEDTIEQNDFTRLVFLEEASELVGELRKYSVSELASLMKVNDDLAHLNFIRYSLWQKEHNLQNSSRAIYSYIGAVYKALNPESFDEGDMDFAQKHLRIISGLYGVIRPKDLIQLYRLEMCTKLQNSSGRDLYAFWRDKITGYFNEEIKRQGDNLLINLASKEYSSCIDERSFKGRIITPVFKEYKNGSYKVIAISAKKARGAMAGYIIRNKIQNPEDIKSFDEDGYMFSDYMSDENQWVFIRG